MHKSNPKGVGYFPEQPGSNGSGKRGRHTKQVKKLRRWIWLSVLGVCFALFVISVALLWRYFDNINRSKQITSGLRADYDHAVAVETLALTADPIGSQAAPFVTGLLVNDQAEAYLDTEETIPQTESENTLFGDKWRTYYASNPDLQVRSQFTSIKKQNKDLVGWLKIPGVVDEPVVQRDNEYYLFHDYFGKENIAGMLFLDVNCDLRKPPMQLVIHGHNMKEGAMFGALRKYKVKDVRFYRQNAYIEFNTIYEDARYVIFAVFEADTSRDHPRFFPFWHYSNFSSKDVFDNYLAKARSLSRYQTKVDVQEGDELLILATCDVTDNGDRLVVMARRIRSGEDINALNTAVLSATSR